MVVDILRGELYDMVDVFGSSVAMLAGVVSSS